MNIINRERGNDSKVICWSFIATLNYFSTLTAVLLIENEYRSYRSSRSEKASSRISRRTINWHELFDVYINRVRGTSEFNLKF